MSSHFLQRLGLPRGDISRSATGFRTAALVTAAVLAAALLMAGCSRSSPAPPGGADLTLSAAASLSDVLRQTLPAFEQAHPGVKVHVNLGSSGALANQVAQGAPVDVFISAGQAQMDQLVRGGFVDAAQVKPFARNRLVLVVPAEAKSAPASWADLTSPQIRHVAVGNPAHVPAGQYAEATLKSLSLWDKLQPKLVLGEDVRQALQFVESGEADAGLVYATDAANAPKVRVAWSVPESDHPPIVYPLAVVKSSAHPEKAAALAEFLLGPDVASSLKAAGFEVSR